ncbi:MAG TPA: hypothetical protein VGN34_30265 [Ktedonobacteraceae bacterium]|jgi:hypothetical protein
MHPCRFLAPIIFLHVLCNELNSVTTVDNPALHTLPLATWFPIYCQFSTRYIELQDLRRDLLERIPPLMYATLYQQSVPVACGLSVVEHGAFGIFDIVTDPEL